MLSEEAIQRLVYRARYRIRVLLVLTKSTNIRD